MSDENLPASRRHVRVCFFNNWAGPLQQTAAFLAGMAQTDLGPRLSDPRDLALRQKAELDFAWYGENARCFAALQHPEIDFLPAWTVGPGAVLEVARAPRETGEERWLLLMGQQPQHLKAMAGPALALLRRTNVRIFYYSFDEASRHMPCFAEIAPFLDVLVHDESPLENVGAERLAASCLRVHRSWVANLVPFACEFVQTPAEKIIFLGSQLGLSAHRLRQIQFLQAKFGAQFVARHDHSLAVADRCKLNEYAVSLCPEGRMFATPGMGATHTDRPFWTGCLGLAVVSENSASGNRLPELVAGRYLESYRHGDLPELESACRRALSWTAAERRRSYDHFNRHETVGTVVADLIAKASPTQGN